MISAIAVHSIIDRRWPFAADYARHCWQRQGQVLFVRRDREDDRPLGALFSPQDAARITRMLVLGGTTTPECVAAFSALKEVGIVSSGDREAEPLWRSAGVEVRKHQGEGFWGQSVAEFGLALTLCALRRIPQTHHEMIGSHEPWNHSAPAGRALPGGSFVQFSDDPGFTNGTLAGKRVRIVGMGNIGSRFASFAAMLRADVAAWDPFATEPIFHRTSTRRVHGLPELVADAQVFAPIVPLRGETRGLITPELIRALPRGCLVLLITRAGVCDMPALRQRVLADELSLAADVFDAEPVPLNDPLLGRHNVVHTPHNAGRTHDANIAYIDSLLELFTPIP